MCGSGKPFTLLCSPRLPLPRSPAHGSIEEVAEPRRWRRGGGLIACSVEREWRGLRILPRLLQSLLLWWLVIVVRSIRLLLVRPLRRVGEGRMGHGSREGGVMRVRGWRVIGAPGGRRRKKGLLLLLLLEPSAGGSRDAAAAGRAGRLDHDRAARERRQRRLGAHRAWRLPAPSSGGTLGVVVAVVLAVSGEAARLQSGGRRHVRTPRRR